MNKRARIRNPEAVEDARKLIQAGADQELILLFMRERKFDQADCVYAFESLYKIKFSEAKNIVFMSKAWSDQYERTKSLHEAARQAVRLLAKESSPDFRVIFEEKDE
jgi:hypothetical protein